MSAFTSYSTAAYFGDSLSDDGNLYDLSLQFGTLGFPFDASGYNQRFTDGLVYAEYASEFLDVDIVANYALGGAQALGALTLEQLVQGAGLVPFLTVPLDDPGLDFDINLSAQTDRFLSDFEGQDLSTVSATIFIGANDYLNFDPSSPAALITEGLALMVSITDAILDEAQDLVAAGVGQIVINGLPTGAFFPAVQSDPLLASAADLVLSLHNSRLETGIEALQDAGVDAVYVDIESMTRAIVEDPLTFGITAPFNEPVVLGSTPEGPVSNPVVADVPLDQVAFFDAVHPTDQIHAVLGKFQAASLTGSVTIGTQFGGVEILGEHADLMLAAAGNDILALRDGDDVAFGELGNDFILGGNGADILSGGAGDDTLIGGTGGDVLAGGAGDDTLRGGAGGDVLIDGLGSDTASGGFGGDVFIFQQAALIGGVDGVDLDVFDGGAGQDLLLLVLSATTAAAYETTRLEFGQQTALDSLGLSITSIETVQVTTDVDDALLLAESTLLQDAALWGLV